MDYAEYIRVSEKETKKITLGNKVRWIFVICFAV